MGTHHSCLRHRPGTAALVHAERTSGLFRICLNPAQEPQGFIQCLQQQTTSCTSSQCYSELVAREECAGAFLACPQGHTLSLEVLLSLPVRRWPDPAAHGQSAQYLWASASWREVVLRVDLSGARMGRSHRKGRQSVPGQRLQRTPSQGGHWHVF